MARKDPVGRWLEVDFRSFRLQGIGIKTFLLSVVLLALAMPNRSWAQTPPFDPDSQAPTASSPPSGERPVSWKRLLSNVASDQKRIWTFPLRAAKGKNLVPLAGVLGATAGLVALDPRDAPYFRRTSSFQGFNRVFSGNRTTIVTALAPGSLYVAGLFRRDSRMQGTALLAAEAVVDAEILATIMKNVDRRLHPSELPPNGNFSDTWFKNTKRILRNAGSFPSGHTIAAFSVATVISRRYPTHRWVPYAAYGLAALVGFSRVSLSSHFVSDVFMGGALGYTIGRFVVLRR